MALNFLNTKERNEIPDGGVFEPSGFVGPWMAGMMWQLYTPSPLPPELAKLPTITYDKSSGFWHYFNDQANAIEVQEGLGLEIKPGEVWHMDCPTPQIVSLPDDVKEKFGNLLRFDVRIRSLASGKYRHEYHMIALPAAVAAVAEVLGFETSGFDVSELTDNNRAYTKEFQFKMIGDPDAKAGDENYFENSVMWQRRVQLWKELGEENPRAYQELGSESKNATTSDKLNQCLSITTFKWEERTYCKVLAVNDPREDAVFGEKRLSIPAIVKLYNSEAEAIADLPESFEYGANVESTPAATSAPVASLAVPEAWVEMPEEWTKSLAEFKADNPTLNAPVIAKATGFLSATKEEIEAWWDQV